MKKESRKQQILECLAYMLEKNPGDKITTAKLAHEVGVSEAALYRHFPSKTKMFEGLIEFIEEKIFTHLNHISQQESNCVERCYQSLTLVLHFTERNPGLTRILTGDVLIGDIARLRERVVQFYMRFEAHLRNVLREAELNESIRPAISMGAATNLLMSVIEGRISQYVRSNFKQSPRENWDDQWPILIEGFFKKTMSGSPLGQH